MPVHMEDREGTDTPPVRLVDAQDRDLAGPLGVPVTVAASVPVLIVASSQPLPLPTTALRLLVATTAAATSPMVDRGAYRGPAALLVANVAGGTPAVSLDIQGSVDGVVWYNAGYALVATPNTVAVAQIAITSTATTTYLLPTDQAWRYLRVVTSAITNETTSVTYYQ